MENDIVSCKLQINLEIAEEFIKELNILVNKYNIIPVSDKSKIILDMGDLIQINNIYRMKEMKIC